MTIRKGEQLRIVLKMVKKFNKKRNPIVRQLRNWYQRIVKSKKLYSRKKFHARAIDGYGE